MIDLLTTAQKSVQLLVPGFRFGQDDISFAERLTDLGVGGFCLYHGSPGEIADLTRRLQARAKIPLLFCADYEDGLPSQVAGGTGFPSNMAIGASRKPELAFEKGRMTALEARAIGVRWIFAPVLDLASQPSNPIVNVRAFGSDPSLAARMGAAYMQGVKAGGGLSCAKHFPGHGETVKDSHLELPVLKLSRERLKRREIVPFLKTKSLSDSIMVAHLKISGLGDASKVPATLSKAVVSGLLREGLKYKGLVVIDALSMNAVARHFKEDAACRLALKAGADVLLVPADPIQSAYAVPELVAKEPELEHQVETAFRRIWKLKETCGLMKDRGIPSEDTSVIGCSAHRSMAEKIAQASVAWARKAKKPLTGPVAYWEPGNSPEEWQGRAFVEQLRALGIQAEPYASQKKVPLIVGIFLSPKAYLGKIQFSAAELRQVQSLIAKAPSSILVSFGSPFVMDQLKSYTAGLCVFSHIEASQRAAARALVGKIKVGGRMPVPLKS